MTLSEVLNQLENKGMTQDEALDNLQSSYNFIIQHIRLTQSVHPVRFNRAFKIAKLGESEHYAQLNPVGSEMCFKEILSFIKTDDSKEYNEFYNLSNLSVGDMSIAGFGWDDFDLVNDEHTSAPCIYQIGSDIVSTNVEDCFCMMQGYVYPYFCKTVNGQNIDRHVYDIREMYEMYGGSLIVDNLLSVLVIMGACAKYARDIGDLSGFNNYRRYIAYMLNIFNKKPASPRIDNWSSIDLIKPDSVRI